jgi:hypothetical protein
MGIALGDVNGDGVLDVFVTNFSEDFATLYAGGPGGIFEDVSRVTGIGPMTYKPLKWGTAFADLDNDGDLDVVVANGHIYPQVDRHPEFIGTYAQRNFVAENLGKGAPLFRDASATAGPGFEEVAAYRGLAVGDFDNDGDLDLLFTRLDGPPVLLRNDSPASGAWLTVIPEGSRGEPAQIGTTVTIRAGGRIQWRDVASGDSYLSTHDPRPHFGLGSAEIVDEVDVKWPDGSHTVKRQVKARQFLHVRKGS